MKRIEFERLLATKGWRLDGENVRGSSGRILITASQSGVGNIDSYYGAFPKLPHEDKQLLLKWAVKYSLTPIKEREEEKKYRVEIKTSHSVFHLWRATDGSGDTDFVIKDRVTTGQKLFTRKEIESIDSRYLEFAVEVSE